MTRVGHLPGAAAPPVGGDSVKWWEIYVSIENIYVEIFIEIIKVHVDAWELIQAAIDDYREEFGE